MSKLYLPLNASKMRVKAAEDARQNRAEIIAAYSQGHITRRDLMKMGLFTAAGLLAPIRGLNPFMGQAYADSSIPTGAPRSSLFGAQPFTQPMCRFDIASRQPVSVLNPAPQAQANTTQRPVDPALGGGTGPIEGRPPGAIWAHQKFAQFPPQVAIVMSQGRGATNVFSADNGYDPGCDSSFNSDIDNKADLRACFHPAMPDQGAAAFWTFGRGQNVSGALPPKLVQARYGEPILFRHYNNLSPNVADNGGFGRNTITTHEHNGHHGAENDGFTGAYFFPGQFYDYHWPFVLAGFTTINTSASDPRAGSPADNGGINKVAGDWHETMSTHWFHDHMFSFTAQNVYKGNAAMLNIYSSLDRGAEDINDGVNLCLPSGQAKVTGKVWGNVQYDVNLMLADKAWDRNGQLFFDIFDTEQGFLGDVMTVNLCFKPYMNVERRKYRFRILNGSVSRFFQISLSDASPMIQIANDGNLLPHPVTLTQLDQQGIAERYDIVIDFSRYKVGDKVWMVNLLQHEDGRGPKSKVSLSSALAGNTSDPCVGKFLEFRVFRDPLTPDVSQVPATMIPNPDVSAIPVTRTRTFTFGDDGDQTSRNPITSFRGPWGIATSGGDKLTADFGRISAAPKFGTREIWTLKNDGGDWDHPIHIHFEEGVILARNGSARNVPAWEQGRKDVYRLHPDGSVTVSIQFRDWGGMFMEHCHNTVHEDNAMLLRWDVNGGGDPFLAPLPTPIPTPQGVTFIHPDDILPNAF